MHLKRFVADEQVFVYDRVLQKSRPSGLERVAAITDYYILKDEDGTRDESVEYGFLKTIEGDASPILDLLDRGAPITDEQHGIAAVFFALLCTRVPAFERAHADLGDALVKLTMRRLAGTPELAAALLRRNDQPRSFSAEQFAEFVSKADYTATPSSNERILTMVTMAEPLITGFESMDWLVLRSTGQRFITSDGPMGFIPLPGAPPIFGELTPNVQKFISLSPATCLMMTDRAGDQPTLAVRNVDTSRVREINLRIAAASTRLVIASQLDDLDDVLATTPLTPVLDEPRATIIEWFDPTLNRSFVISIRVQADAVFPLPLSLPWECRGCGNCATAEFIVANLSKAQNPRALSEWLNTPCRKCQKSPRVTGSRFTANTINMSPGAHVK